MQVNRDRDEKTGEGDTVTDPLHEGTCRTKCGTGDILATKVVDDSSEGLSISASTV